jgi:putative sterol carrier protein
MDGGLQRGVALMTTDQQMSARDFVNQVFPAALEMMKEKTRGLNHVLGLRLAGEGGGAWTVKINDGSATLEEGVTDYWDCALCVPARDYLSLAMGQMSPYEAAAQGKIGISGDLGLAAKLRSLFRI